MKNLLLILLGLLFKAQVNAQIVHIPDANFKAALLANPVINTNGDGEIQVSEANAYDDALLLSGLGISDLTGIEAFTALKTLDCSSNNLFHIDLSNNLLLEYLDCSFNQIFLFEFNLGQKDFLYHLRADYIDSMSDNGGGFNFPNLKYFYHSFSVATNSIQLNATQLEHFECHDNPSLQTAIVDQASSANLKYVDVSNNDLQIGFSPWPSTETYITSGNSRVDDINLNQLTSLKHLEADNVGLRLKIKLLTDN